MEEVIADLPAEERVRCYREMAQETHTLAMKAENPQVRSAYLQLAARWLALSESSGRIAAAEQRNLAPED